MASQQSVFQTVAQDATLTGGGLRGVTGPIVKVPFGTVTFAVIGSASVNVNAALSSGTPNRDGSATRVVATVPAAIPGGAVIRDQIWGRVVGVRWNRDSSTGTTPFDVVIDGVAYPVDDAKIRRDARTSTGGDPEALCVVASGLADTVHTVELHVTADGVTAQSLVFWGWLGEAGRGHQNPVPPRVGAVMVSPIALTTTLAAISFSGLAVGLSFYNTDASNPHTVTITEPSGATYRKVTIPADSGTTLLFPTQRSLTNWKAKADLGAVVNIWPEVN